MRIRKGSRARELTFELVVGTFILLVLLGLGVFTIILSRENLFGPDYDYTVRFDDVLGLRNGDNVVIRGMVVGRIVNMTLKDDGVYVEFNLRTYVKWKDDYSIVIVPTSVLGGRYMQIHAGSAEAPDLVEPSVFEGHSPNDVFTEAARLISTIRTTLEGDLVKDAKAIVQNVRNTLEKGKVTENLEGLFADARLTAAQLKEIATKINKGEGTVGKLIQDEEIYVELRNILNEGGAVIEDLRETAPVVSFSSILFGAL
ncbi:MAG: MCE family protein [Kiritimatiellae bacterium]|nr:MCE family protein [Kiritimatiellia bacterium]